MKKSIPIIREWESEAFILGNGREREFPLTPASQKIFIMILFVAGIVDEYGHKYRIGALWKSNMILSLSSLRQLEAMSGRSFRAEPYKIHWVVEMPSVCTDLVLGKAC